MAIDLFAPGAYARAAGGNLERPDIQKPVIKWMAWSINSDNGGGGSVAVWDTCRALWKANGIYDFPWMHCRSIADVEHLISVGESEVSPAIGLNIENVVDLRSRCQMKKICFINILTPAQDRRCNAVHI